MQSVHTSGSAVRRVGGLIQHLTRLSGFIVSASVLFRLTPCDFELTAALIRVTAEHTDPAVTGGVNFLLDGSGSVSQGMLKN